MANGTEPRRLWIDWLLTASSAVVFFWLSGLCWHDRDFRY